MTGIAQMEMTFTVAHANFSELHSSPVFMWYDLHVSILCTKKILAHGGSLKKPLQNQLMKVVYFSV